MNEPEGNQPSLEELADRLIRIADPDAPIYRILPLWFLEETFRLKQLVLVSPRLWEDPLEIVGEPIAVNLHHDDRVEQQIINQSLPPAFAQCWSATAESDTLLRAYSRVVKDPHFGRNICPREEGVRVRSTGRKLLQAVIAGSAAGPKGYWFLGAVKYLSRALLLQEIANAIVRNGLGVFEVPSNRAKLLLLKRDAFSHEAEVRLLFVQHDAQPRADILQIPIEPSSVFDEISFDPRLKTFERRERETWIARAGFTGVVRESDLYQRTLLEVDVNQSDNSGEKSSAA